MPKVDSQRYKIPINVNSYLNNKQIFRDLLVLDSQYLYVLADYKTKEIQAVDHSPHLLNYLRYGLPDSTVTVYPKNIDIQFSAGLAQAKLSFLKELCLLIENKLCNLIKYPPFLSNYYAIAAGDTKTLAFTPLAGILSQSKMIPLKYCPLIFKFEVFTIYS